MTGGNKMKGTEDPNVLCTCGCGKSVRFGNKYIIGHNRRKPTDIDKVVYLYANEKLSPYEISEKLGYSVNRVKRCLRQRNVKLRNRNQAASSPKR